MSQGEVVIAVSIAMKISIMLSMANHAYVSFWTADNSVLIMLDRFERMLETIPLSSTKPGFANLTIRAIGPAETPLFEHDLRSVQATPADVIGLARDHLNADVAYEVEAYWDLWQREQENGQWRRTPERLMITCNGETYDDGVAAQAGQLNADLGFESFYTGHSGLLGSNGGRSAPADPVEAEFISLMTHEEHLHEYYEKTRENIQQLLRWVRSVEQALPIAKYKLWTEGEENFEARLDEILAVH